MATGLLDDELWKLIEPLLPVRKRRFHHPGRKRLDDRRTLAGILFVLRTGIAWQQLPQELGYGSGMTCWRRLKEWQQAGVFQALHQRLLAQLRAAGRLDLSTAVCDSASLRALLGARRPAPVPLTGANSAASTT
jgi:transposase